MQPIMVRYIERDTLSGYFPWILLEINGEVGAILLVQCFDIAGSDILFHVAGSAAAEHRCS